MNTSNKSFYSNIALLMSAAVLLGTGCELAEGQNAPGDIYPQGQKLLFSAYTLHEPQLSQARAAGFTAIGPYHSANKAKAFGNARKSGLPLIYSVGPKVDFDAPAFTPDQLLEQISAEVRQVAATEPVAMWNVRNEELRYWKPTEMDWLARITQVIGENDPAGRPIMMYEPNHRRADELMLTAKHLTAVAKGSYSNFVGMKQKRTWLRWSMEQTLAVSEQTGNLPIAVLWMYKDQETADEIAAIPSWVRHDVYLSLMSGAKGIIVYSAANRRKGFEKHFSLFFDAYAKTATELNGPRQLGRVFLFGKSGNNLKVSQTGGPDSQRFVYQEKEYTYPVLHNKQLELDGAHYLFLSNSANTLINVAVTGLDENRKVTDVFSGEPVSLTGALSLKALEIRALRWE